MGMGLSRPSPWGSLNVWNISKLAVGRLSPKYLNGIIGLGLALLAIFRCYQGVDPILSSKNNPIRFDSPT